MFTILASYDGGRGWNWKTETMSFEEAKNLSEKQLWTPCFNGQLPTHYQIRDEDREMIAIVRINESENKWRDRSFPGVPIINRSI